MVKWLMRRGLAASTSVWTPTHDGQRDLGHTFTSDDRMRMWEWKGL